MEIHSDSVAGTRGESLKSGGTRAFPRPRGGGSDLPPQVIVLPLKGCGSIDADECFVPA